MRLRTLLLDRFGHFTDQKYDFGDAGDKPDFHIIFGSNEAGKTTTMEAALRLFYGFSTREPYAFKHQRANLQVSAQLDINGQLRSFTRLPKRNGALLDGAGTPVPEAALAAHLGGLSEADYRSLLCLDDDTIERGGEEIAQAKGDIGRLLFSAAAGVSDLSTVLENVRDKADALWRKRAKTTRVAELKRALVDIEKSIRDGDTSASAWRGLKKVAQDAQRDEDEARKSRDQLLEGMATIAAKRRALPQLVDFDALMTRIIPFANYPDQLDFDPESLIKLVAQDSHATEEKRRLDQVIEKATAELAAINVTPKALELSAHLNALEDLRSRDRTAALDINRRRDTQRNAETAMSLAANDLDVAVGIDLQTLVLSPAEIDRLDTARDALRTATTAAKAESLEAAELSERFDIAKIAHDAAAASAPKPHNVAEILARYDVEHLAPAFALAQNSMRAATAAARDTLFAIGADLEAIPPCPTSEIKAQEWVQNNAELIRNIGQTDVALSQHQEDEAALRSQVNSITSTGGIVLDAQADALKLTRDALWLAHSQTKTDDTAQAFEDSMRALDAAVTTRVTQANDLGRLRQIEQARAEAGVRGQHAEKRLEKLHAQQFDLQTQIDIAAQSVGLQCPQLPAEWLRWVQLHGQAVTAEQALAQARATHQPTLDRADELLDELGPHLTQDMSNFDHAIAAARKRATDEQNQLRNFEKSQDALDIFKVDLDRRIKKHQEKQKIADTLDVAWRLEVVALLGNAITPDTLLAAIGPLRALREQNDKRAEAAQRVRTMQADQDQFETAVTALAKDHDLPQGATPSATFTALQTYAEAAKAAKTQMERCSDQITQARDALQKNHAASALNEQQVESIRRVFPADAPVDTLDTLRKTVGQAQQVIRDRMTCETLNRTLCADLSAPNLEAARAQLGEASAVALAAQADSFKADLSAAEHHLTSATETRVTAEQALAQVTGDAAIATLTERKATLELELEDAALEHLELALGHRVADEAIRRYRDTHRSGMMADTEQSFATLTQGAYPRLITQPDGTGETLLAVDKNGTTKRAADMSKGTRFQLYLALRAAAHKQLVTQGTCLPFFCDDIFETFDEDRTSAACRVMEHIGRTGQAIYLTHHRHVVEIAQQVCDTPPTVHYV